MNMINDEKKTKKHLIKELVELRKEVSELADVKLKYENFLERWAELENREYRNIEEIEKNEDINRLLLINLYEAFKENALTMTVSDLEEGRFIVVNRGFSETLGYEQEEVIGKTAVEVGIFAKDTQYNAVKEFLREGCLRNFPLTAQAKDGSILNGLWSAQLIVIGSKKYLFSVIVNDTNFKTVENKYRQSNKRLQNLLDLNRAIMEFRSPVKIARDALERIQKLVPCQRLTLILMDYENNELELLAVRSSKNYSMKTKKRNSMEPYKKYFDEMKKGEVILTRDSADRLNEFQLAKVLYDKGFRSSIAVPLIFQDNLIGSINMLSNTRDYFTEEYIEIARDIAAPVAIAIQQARLYESLQENRKRLEALSRKSEESRENERRYIAQEVLHDGIGQELTVLKFNLFNMKRDKDKTSLLKEINESLFILDNVMKEIRDLSIDLRPPIIDDFGLVPTLEWLLDRYFSRTNVSVYFNADNLKERLSKELETACFRIVQEALTNITRHAKAKKISVTLLQEKSELILKISDDGIGFNIKRVMSKSALGDNLGLLGMRERVELIGGKLKIMTYPGNGTRIEARFPFQAYDKN